MKPRRKHTHKCLGQKMKWTSSIFIHNKLPNSEVMDPIAFLSIVAHRTFIERSRILLNSWFKPL